MFELAKQYDGRVTASHSPSGVEVTRLKPVRRWVIRRGKVIAETTSPQALLGAPVPLRNAVLLQPASKIRV